MREGRGGRRGGGIVLPWKLQQSDWEEEEPVTGQIEQAFL